MFPRVKEQQEFYDYFPLFTIVFLKITVKELLVQGRQNKLQFKGKGWGVKFIQYAFNK